ncbi:DUF2182 domain-containing protein [Halomonas sp. TRM85114]|uniref:DUF2182 domain-containing protein n=1 Tax=Halomonas jincaotanensis TaxID=2810616 RepID=UPI001BD51718|nr:DUF2182 domain-containing protein [Halomonas jincaotanensis]MBS9402627.1 DUF2182 domain-containing protein [Halomonas jincaotanensis]
MEMTMSRIHSHERVLTATALVALTMLAWWHLIMQGSADGMSMSMPASSDWGLQMLGVSVLMWSVMMIAMMLPSAGPMILTYTRVYQKRRANGSALVPTWLFVVGYLTIWVGFAIFAALAQWSLHQSTLLSSAMGHVGPLLGGSLLIMAGAFQFSGLKQACLGKCRTPLSFLTTEWREGRTGAFTMGLRHGAFCTGCCWALMLLMFVGGVMSLVWMVALAVYLLTEKLLPRADDISRLVGGLLVLAGIALPLVMA